MRRVLAVALLVAGGFEGSAWAVGKDKAKYVGGTVNVIPAGTEGMLGTSDSQKVMFLAEKGGAWSRSNTRP